MGHQGFSTKVISKEQPNLQQLKKLVVMDNHGYQSSIAFFDLTRG
jgi:hypothetical protein